MKPVVFARVADMKYYQGITDQDTPSNGGSYVNDTGLAHECYNFAPIVQEGNDYEKCLGFVMMSGGNGAEQLHIEKIPGCEGLKHEDAAYGVTVIFVSKAISSKSMRVVGFYKDAVVYRYPQYMEFDGGYCQEYSLRLKKRIALFCHTPNDSAIHNGMFRQARQSIRILGSADLIYGLPVRREPPRRNVTTWKGCYPPLIIIGEKTGWSVADDEK